MCCLCVFEITSLGQTFKFRVANRAHMVAVEPLHFTGDHLIPLGGRAL
jgi:hypothetical protein